MDLLQIEQTGLQNSKCVQQQREMKIMSILPSVSPDEDSQANTGPSSHIHKQNKNNKKSLKITEESTVNVKTKKGD